MFNGLDCVPSNTPATNKADFKNQNENLFGTFQYENQRSYFISSEVPSFFQLNSIR